MKDLLVRLTSRKFLLALAAIIGNIAFAISGQLTFDQAFENVKLIVLAYIAAEGTADTIERFQQGKVQVEKQVTKQLEAVSEVDETK